MTSKIQIQFTVISTLIGLTNAMASDALLVRKKTPGFAPPAYQVSETCSITKDSIRLQQSVGEATAERVVPLKALNETVIKDLIEKAAKCPIKEIIAPADLPTTYHESYLTNLRGKRELVLLRAEGSVGKSRDNCWDADNLIGFIDKVCGN